MRTIRLLAPSRLEMRETDERPAITDSTVRVDIKACGICGSDLALYNGRRDLSGEHYFGHEFSGVITEVGNGANGLKKRDARRQRAGQGLRPVLVLPQRHAELL